MTSKPQELERRIKRIDNMVKNLRKERAILLSEWMKIKKRR